ncbi:MULTISPECIES: 5-guanidino-2-oxopentanoate decarboxylase [Caballeronia]|uniref:5-guanidino-2-oxopentanoate decarboxylase n=1 Tax=Caballeronia TaxID=1827195 RepID=UPI001589300D|nr:MULTISPECIES: 5-guanidino-2-oxopentanoate decarboxylase [Caballeronia]MCG7404060.1 5-guanidino-2-oxopentanoate decarboxylase [Caballeronia zhejiangensis]MCI1045371.1 5-guanidino-2-oxopentanoate decarboxylase [Caballeronia zhejiangensis]
MNLRESTRHFDDRNVRTANGQAGSRHRTCGESLVTLLEIYGVQYVFGIPGVHTVELYRGLARSSIRHVTPRHEQGAGFMADGYARVTGKPGVCFIITGPGMTNIATAMAQAHADSIPMLVISSVNARSELGSGDGRLHELPSQREVFNGLAAFSHTLLDAADLPQVLARAFAVFESARPRPVHIEIPLDVIVSPAGVIEASCAVRAAKPAAHPAALAAAAELLAEARRPLILAGGGAADAAAELRELAERLQAPVALTTNAKGLLPSGQPLLIGSTQSLPHTRAMIREADVVLAVGTELGETDYDVVFDGGFAIAGKLIRIDIDAQQLMRNVRPDVAIVSDAREALSELSTRLHERPVRPPATDWGAARVAAVRAANLAGCDAAMRSQQRLIDTIVGTLPGVVIAGDSTSPVYAGNFLHDAPAPRSWFNSSTGYGTLGYGLPAAIGAKLAAPRRPVVCLIGDGGLQFTLPELASAVEARVPVIVMLWNNFGYGEIRKYMAQRDITPVGVDIYTPDFAALAKAFGCEAARVDDPRTLEAELRRAVSRDVPTVIEVREADWFARVPS